MEQQQTIPMQPDQHMVQAGVNQPAWALQMQGNPMAMQAYPILQGQAQPGMQQPQMVLTGKSLPGNAIYYQPGMPQMMGAPAGQQQPGQARPGQPVLLTASNVPGASAFPQLQGAAYPTMMGVSGGMQMPTMQMTPQMMAQMGGNTFAVRPGYALAPMTIQPLTMHPQAVTIKPDNSDDRPSSSHSANTSAGGIGSEGGEGSPQVGMNKSQYRGVSYDRKKAKWRVQIKVAALGKSGVSVGYFDTEEAAARAYDRAAIGLLGRDNPNLQTNFELDDYAGEHIPPLTGKSREEVKTTLKSERIKQAPRRRFTSRQRTSRFMGVGSSNRKNQWQARILVHGKVTHLGYYETEEEAARVYDRVSLALHGDHAQTNFPASNYPDEELRPFRGLDREDLQRALGVKPMDKSSQYRGVSKKKGKWEAKVMVNRRWAYRELFDSEEEAARAYDRALWRLKPREARSYVNFKDEVPAGLELEGMGGAPGTYRMADPQDDSDDAGAADDGSGDDFQYDYRPTKGTRRSASMRAKKAGSAPNLAAAAAAAAQQQQQQQQLVQPKLEEPGEEEEEEDLPEDGGLVFSAPTFVPMGGAGELQLQFGGEGPDLSQSIPHIVSAGSGMIPNPGSTEPLLVRVGSETHFLPPSSGAGSLLGKRTGMQRIQSEPHFGVHATTSGAGGLNRSEAQDLMAGPSGPTAGDIHDLMNDSDLFNDFLNDDGHDHHDQAAGNLALELLPPPPQDTDMQSKTHLHSMGGLSGLFFEDEEAALANLEFSRPRKMTKSMSMSQLSSLMGDDNTTNLAPLQPADDGAGGSGGQDGGGGSSGEGSGATGKGGGSPSPTGSSGDTGSGGNKLGPLGQPIRRINTFTTSLQTFEEGEEHKDVDPSGALLSPRLAKLTMTSNHSSEDDLFKRLLDPNIPLAADDPLRMLGDFERTN